MHKLKKIVNLVVLLPLGVVLIVLAVANRQIVTLALNPFRPQDSVLAVSAPFFLFLFVALLLGMVLGSGLTWWTQGKYRKQARIEAREAVKWKSEHETARQQGAQVATAQQQLPAK